MTHVHEDSEQDMDSGLGHSLSTNVRSYGRRIRESSALIPALMPNILVPSDFGLERNVTSDDLSTRL